MSTPDQPGGPDPQGPDQQGYVPVSPLLGEDPPKIGDFWLDSRLGNTPAGVAYVAHDDDQPVLLILLSEGASEDAAARDRLSGVINKMHIDDVVARGGHGQGEGRLGRKFRSEEDDPVGPDHRPLAPWAAIPYDGSPAAAALARAILDEVEMSRVEPQGSPSGPDYRHYWLDRIKPGLARLWPLPWPGRFDRAGWKTILVSWLLMLLLAALAILIAILIFQNAPPQSPPPPRPPTGSPPPQSGSPPPQSGSPSPQSGSPSPQSGSPSPQSGSPSEQSPSQTPSMSGSPSPGESGQPTPSDSGSPGGGSSPRSRL
ncbi:MAG: hypothetical protein ACTH2Q_08070 [Propionibacteriaceae bacterium]